MSERPRTDLEAVYREQASRLWRAVVLYAGDREIASDAVAEAFAQAMRHGASIRDPARWVWRAAFHLALDELEARRRTIELVDERYEMPESLADLVHALRGLSHHQRASVILHDYAGYSRREIAEVLGSSPSAVGVHLFRARRRLRSDLEVRDD
ncbi:MAG: RNA polymerase sigma factor [Actinomycetota bacterium]